MPWSWGLVELTVAKHFLPRIVIDVVLKEVIHSVEAIISSKDKNRPRVDHRDVPVSRRWRHVVSLYFLPSVLLNIVHVKVIFPLNAIIPTEDVDVVFKSNT